MHLHIYTKDRQPAAAGCVIVAPSGKLLLLQRSAKTKDFQGSFCIPGGSVDAGESPLQACLRESREEAGVVMVPGRLSLADTRGFGPLVFYTYVTKVDWEFTPKINEESQTFTWAHPSKLPHPMHPNCQAILETLTQRQLI
jgi:8-oxo-dGTP pyrophosphatase MutT (NUDIX family)